MLYWAVTYPHYCTDSLRLCVDSVACSSGLELESTTITIKVAAVITTKRQSYQRRRLWFRIDRKIAVALKSSSYDPTPIYVNQAKDPGEWKVKSKGI